MFKVGVCAIDSQSLTHYVILRRDLPIGVMVANTIHAAGESGGAPPGTFAVALAAKDKGHLEKVRDHLQLLQVPYAAIVETQGEYAGELMAIGIQPLEDRSLVRKAVSSLPLVK